MKHLTLSARYFFGFWVCVTGLDCGLAQATVIFDSLDQTQVGYFPISGEQFGVFYGASFLSGALASTLTSASVFLYDCCQPTGSFSISLFSNSVSNQPGSLLETLATPADSILPNRTFGAFTYSGHSYEVAPNTEYWIVLSSSDSSLGWVGTSSTSGIGVAGQYYYDGGGGPPVGTVLNGSGFSPFALQMEIDTTVIAAAPEPRSLFLLCGSLIAGGAAFAVRKGGC